MSKTRKTRPVWVQMIDPSNRGWLIEDHDHRRSECTIDTAPLRNYWIRRYCCEYRPSVIAANEGIYPAASRVIAMYRRERTRESRAEWRQVSRELLKMKRQDVYDSEYAATQHRRSAKWDAY